MAGREIRVRGQVQGVGFRPFVWKLAHQFGLCGEVLNHPDGVLIRVAGKDLDGFEVALLAEAPVLARVDAIESAVSEIADRIGFEIVASLGQGPQTGVMPDVASCSACLGEVRDPQDRRFGYAFANCTGCGPRFSILHRLPYDRGQTTMAAFDKCDDCTREYADPDDRRFHAQPVACPACGPRVWGEPGGTGDPIGAAAAVLHRGGVLAIKGLSGFHLAVDARNSAAIMLLRQRKRRPAKPFALMGHKATISRHAAISRDEGLLLDDPAAPIVLLAKAGEALPEALAQGQRTLGWMLPYTPLHHLLLDTIDGPLVMTSGNLPGEPQVIGNDEARQKLSGFADAFLMHNREIARRLDDSVERVTPHGTTVLRRARGRVPGTLAVPPGFDAAPQITAYGGQMKAAICLLKNGRAMLGHPLGDLDQDLTWEAFLAADRDYAALFDHAPDLVACDLHPDFRSSRLAAGKGLPMTEVQHHHAHMAACMGENGWALNGGPVAGIILDGLGLGDDGSIWGGELLLGDYGHAARVAHLAPAPLPGGDAAQRDPWRNLLVRLDQAGLSDLANDLLSAYPVNTVRQAVKAGINAPMSSSAGRLFDAFAAGLGLVPDGQSYEAEAAMRLETVATAAGIVAPYPFGTIGAQIDPAPMFRAWATDRSHGVPKSVMAARFHAGLAQSFALRAKALVDTGRARAVALSGGCFQNLLLLDLTLEALKDVPVLIHSQVPCNDGGLALGQALVAAARVLRPPVDNN